MTTGGTDLTDPKEISTASSEEWYWCSVCEEAGEDNCGFYFDDEGTLEPECPNCGTMGEGIQV